MSKEPPEGFRSSGPTPRGTRLVLIRHGEADCNVEGRVGGERGCTGLTDRGRAQADALRQRLAHTREFDAAVALYSSVLPRARETLARLLPALPAVPVREDCGLCEMHPGEADGMTWENMVATFGAVDWDENPHQPLSPGGESWVSMGERVVAALTAIAERHPGQLVIIATHGGVIEHAMKWVQGAAPSTRLRLRTEHCSMMELELDEGVAKLLRYNDRAALVVD